LSCARHQESGRGNIHHQDQQRDELGVARSIGCKLRERKTWKEKKSRVRVSGVLDHAGEDGAYKHEGEAATQLRRSHRLSAEACMHACSPQRSDAARERRANNFQGS
jgi:hypothetical protein